MHDLRGTMHVKLRNRDPFIQARFLDNTYVAQLKTEPRKQFKLSTVVQLSLS